MSSNDDHPQSPGMRLELVVSSAIVVAGLTFAGFGILHYGVWQNNGPGPGFFPAAAGILAAICAAAELLRRAPAGLAGVRWQDFSPLAAAILVVILARLIGMAEATTLFVFTWVAFVERRGWRQALAAALIALAIVHVMFSLWLGVRFPDSVLPSLLSATG